MYDSLDDDFNETETREFITDKLKAKDWKLKLNMRYEYKITDGRIQIDEDEIIFEVSENWCWCRLVDVCTDSLIPQQDKTTALTGTITWSRIEDIERKYINGTHSNKYVSEETVKT